MLRKEKAPRSESGPMKRPHPPQLPKPEAHTRGQAAWCYLQRLPCRQPILVPSGPPEPGPLTGGLWARTQAVLCEMGTLIGMQGCRRIRDHRCKVWPAHSKCSYLRGWSKLGVLTLVLRGTHLPHRQGSPEHRLMRSKPWACRVG